MKGHGNISQQVEDFDNIRPGVGGGRGGQNWGQILNVIFRNLHPYRL